MKIPAEYFEDRKIETLNEDKIDRLFCDYLDEQNESLFGIAPSRILGDMDPICYDYEKANFTDLYFIEVEDEDGDPYWISSDEDVSKIKRYQVRFVTDWIPADPEPDGEGGHENNGYHGELYSTDRDFDADLVELFEPDSRFVTLGDLVEVWSPDFETMRGYVFCEGEPCD
jgi:hypothetical protein